MVASGSLSNLSTPTPELTDDLDLWEVTLTTGDVLTLRAHGCSERDGFWTFVALMRGKPHYEYELVRIPAAIVAGVIGGGRDAANFVNPSY